jgi:hypothetical protein
VNIGLMLKVRWYHVGSSPLTLHSAHACARTRAHNAGVAATGLAIPGPTCTPPPPHGIKLARLRATTATCCRAVNTTLTSVNLC